MLAILSYAFLPPGLFWLMFLFVMAFAIYAQFKVSSSFSKYSRVRSRSGATGARAAREILDAAEIHNVDIEVTESFLGDHYDPLHKKLVLSHNVANSDSVAALGVAAHECGHAIQHKAGYAPLKARMTLIPVTMFASNLLPFVVLGGFLFRWGPLIDLGIVVYAVLTLFHLITLPVEFDADRKSVV